MFVIAIYAAIGTEYFAEEIPDGFCDFFHAFYTLFSVIAYSEDGGITIFDDDGNVRTGRAAFVYSYVAIVVIMMLQVATGDVICRLYFLTVSIMKYQSPQNTLTLSTTQIICILVIQ